MADSADSAELIARLSRRIDALERRATDPPPQRGDFMAKEGQTIVVSPPSKGLTALLPKASAFNKGERIQFFQKSANKVTLRALGGLINGQPFVMSNAPGFFEAISDGETGWSVAQSITVTGVIGAPGTPASPGSQGAPGFADLEASVYGGPVFALAPPGAAGAAGDMGPQGPPVLPAITEPYPFLIAPPGLKGDKGDTGPAGSSSAGSGSPPHLPSEYFDCNQGLYIPLPPTPGATGATGPAGQSIAAPPGIPLDYWGDMRWIPLPPGAPTSLPASLPTIQPGSFLGLQVNAAGAVAAIEITGAEAGQNIRFANRQTDSTSTGVVNSFVLNATTTQVLITAGAGNITLNGIAVPAVLPDGREIAFVFGSTYANTTTVVSLSGTGAANITTPEGLNLAFKAGDSFKVRYDSATGAWRMTARSNPRSAVQLNAAAVAPVETINFSDSSRVNVTSSSISAGVASMLFNTITAAQLDLDTGTDINKALTSVLLGFRPGLTTSSNTGTVNSTAVQVGPLYTVPANTMVVGSCYLLIGFASFVRSTTTTAITLVTSLTVPAAVPVTAGIAASVTPSVNRGALVFAFVHCETSGAGGTARANVGVVGQWGAGGATATDMTASTIAVSINTTIANTLSLGVACSAAVAGAGVFWQNSAVLRIK